MKYTESQMRERLCPHNPHCVEGWETPRDIRAAKELVGKLPKEQRVIAYLTAIETAIESCQERFVKPPVPDVNRALHAYLQPVYEWLGGPIESEEGGNLPHNSSAQRLIIAAKSLADLVQDRNTRNDVLYQAFNAPNFIYPRQNSADEEIIPKWWRRVLCRLAIQDADSARIERQSLNNPEKAEKTWTQQQK